MLRGAYEHISWMKCSIYLRVYYKKGVARVAFILGCEKASLAFPTKLILKPSSFGISEGDRIGIVGPNGAGKSSILKLLAQDIVPDEGRVTSRKGIRVGRLHQKDQLNDEDTVKRAVVGDLPDYLWAGDPRIRDIMSGLLSDIESDARVGELSGGQRRRIDLARLLIGEWDVLMLDEPTNHLDMVAIVWLAEHLKQRWRPGQGALLLVTHDRWFLDEVCSSMWEIHDGIVEPFEGGYSAYVLQRVERDRQIQVAEQKRKNLMRKELAWLSRGAPARSSKPKFHIAQARALIETEPPVRNKLELQQMAMTRLGKQVLSLESARLRRGSATILDGVDWIIGPGDRIGIVGLNGAGKSSLLSVLQGSLALDDGQLKTGKTVKIAVLSQQLEELYQYAEDRVHEVLGRYKTRYRVDGRDLTPGQMIERLGFEKDHLNSRVKDLSGGQRRRLQFMLILLDEPNVLILDEPGNDLDTDMLAVMEDMLDSWPGTLLLVTHDRYFMERVTDDQYALIDGHIRHLPGGVDEFMERFSSGSSQAVDSMARPSSASSEPKEQIEGVSSKEAHQAKKTMASYMRKISTLESKIKDAQAALMSIEPSDYLALGEAQAAISDLEAQKDELEEAWMELALLLES